MNISQYIQFKNPKMSNMFAALQPERTINSTLSVNPNHHLERNSSIIFTK